MKVKSSKKSKVNLQKVRSGRVEQGENTVQRLKLPMKSQVPVIRKRSLEDRFIQQKSTVEV